MYRINVLSYGKHGNVDKGSRYCFTKKSAKNLINLFLEEECTIDVEKLVRIHDDVFCWTDEDTGDKVITYFWDRVVYDATHASSEED